MLSLLRDLCRAPRERKECVRADIRRATAPAIAGVVWVVVAYLTALSLWCLCFMLWSVALGVLQ